MDAELPPVPPRPDLGRQDVPPATWREVDPGRMGAAAIVGAGVRIWSKNWFPWFLVTLAMTGVISVIIAAVDPWTGAFGAQGWFSGRPTSRPDPNASAVILSLVLSLFLTPWLVVVLSRGTLLATFREPPIGRAMIGKTIRGVHSVVWIIVLLVLFGIPVVLILVGIGAAVHSWTGATALLLLIPLALVLVLVPRIATCTHIFVAEDLRGSRAIAGAWGLSKGAWGTSAGTLLLFLLLGIAVSIIPGIVVGGAFSDPVVGDPIPRAVIQALLTAVTTPMSTAVIAALYLELHARKGTLDQQTLRTNLARFD